MPASAPREIRPASIAELAQAVAEVAASKRSVTPVGGGSHLAFGRSSREPDVVLHTSGLRAVVEHEPDDMTISVEAGLTAGALRALLARHRSGLPIDVEHPESSTVGGAVAFGAVGPRRFAAGTLRDRLIGARVVMADGSVVKTGGMVVKNVSGYDLTRMLHGSMGALGVIASLNFKLSPLPDARAALTFEFGSHRDAVSAAAAAVATRLPFAAVHARSDGTMLVGCEGHAADARRLRSEARAVAMRHGAEERGAIDDPSEVESFWRSFMLAPFGERTATFRIASAPSRIARDIEAAAASARRLGLDLVWSIDAGCGTGELSVETGPSIDALARLERDLIDTMPSVRVMRCPLDARAGLVLLGRPPAAAGVMRALRAQFDPGGIFATDAFASKEAARG